MRGFEVSEKLSRGPEPTLFGVLKALTDALRGMGTGGYVEQALIGFGILYNGRRFPLHGQHHGALGFLELFHKTTSPGFKGFPCPVPQGGARPPP